eukprot:23147-Pelagococcus_subviridis.AAC.3
MFWVRYSNTSRHRGPVHRPPPPHPTLGPKNIRSASVNASVASIPTHCVCVKCLDSTSSRSVLVRASSDATDRDRVVSVFNRRFTPLSSSYARSVFRAKSSISRSLAASRTRAIFASDRAAFRVCSARSSSRRR